MASGRETGRVNEENRMKHPRLVAAVLSAALFASSAVAWAAERERYVEAFVGGTRGPSVNRLVEEARFSLDPETDLALGLVVGKRISDAFRVEFELAYPKVKWDAGDSVSITTDGYGIGPNLLCAIGESSARFEIGIGAGWTFFDEACAESGTLRYCADAAQDDWAVQGIAGSSYAVSDTGALVARYRMKNIGGLSSDDRIHAFSVGYRHDF